MNRYEDPLALVDVTLFTIQDGRLSLLLATRKNRDEPYFGALDYPWAADDDAMVDSLVPKGHPSTPGYHDPAYPFIGR